MPASATDTYSTSQTVPEAGTFPSRKYSRIHFAVQSDGWACLLKECQLLSDGNEQEDLSVSYEHSRAMPKAIRR